MSSWTEIAKKKGIRYFLIAFVDLLGTLRAKIVPATAMEDVVKSGAGFSGFAAWFDLTPADPNVVAMPDKDSLIQLPWKREVAWVTGDLESQSKKILGRSSSVSSLLPLRMG